jgi:small subunit ribosomal protein S21
MHSDENDAVVGEGVTPRVEAAIEAPVEATEGEDRDAEGRDGERRTRRRADGFGETVQCRPLEVIVKDDRVEQAIRQLKNRLAREGVLRELKNRRHYFKPSELKRIKSREAARRRRKQARQRPRTK